MRMFAGDVLPSKISRSKKKEKEEIGKQTKKGMTRWGNFFREKHSWYFTENKMWNCEIEIAVARGTVI